MRKTIAFLFLVLWLPILPATTFSYDGKGGYEFKSDTFALSLPEFSLYLKAGRVEIGYAAKKNLPFLYSSPYSHAFSKKSPALGFEKGKSPSVLFSYEPFYLLFEKGERESMALFFDEGPILFTAAAYSQKKGDSSLFERRYEKQSSGFLRLGLEFSSQCFDFFLLLDTAFSRGSSLVLGTAINWNGFRLELIEGTAFASEGERRRIKCGYSGDRVSFFLEKTYGHDPVFFEEYRPLTVKSEVSVEFGIIKLKGRHTHGFSAKGIISESGTIAIEAEHFGFSLSTDFSPSFSVKTKALSLTFDGKHIAVKSTIRRGSISLDYTFYPEGRLSAGLTLTF
jgi:hypothetical protein